MSASDDQAMLKRLRELEEENARLRNARPPETGATLSVTEGDYKGHPTLTFEGPFRSFTLGLKKLTVIKELWPQVEAFLDRHARTPSGRMQADDSDDKL